MHKNINGHRAHFGVERAINELRCGRAVYFRGTGSDNNGALLASAETLSEALLTRLEERTSGAGVALVITRQRAETLGLLEAQSSLTQSSLTQSPLTQSPLILAQTAAIVLRMRPPASLATVRALVGIDADLQSVEAVEPAVDSMSRPFTIEACDAVTAAILRLPKRARLLPALLMIEASAPSVADEVLEVSTSQIEGLAEPGVADLERISEARVPLAGHEDCRLVLFRDTCDATEHVAVIIGTPDPASAVPVRLHSACLTGDLLGSLRCDCGDQLRGAVEQLAASGGGVLLYLAQEGRGIGLANKLRAYELQDMGLDTLEADRHLGFSDDERSYAVAADMLHHLGLTRIQLLTNNLDKVDGLREGGIEVVSDQRLMGALNRHNARYLRAKREHAGHLLPDIQVEEML